MSLRSSFLFVFLVSALTLGACAGGTPHTEAGASELEPTTTVAQSGAESGAAPAAEPEGKRAIPPEYQGVPEAMRATISFVESWPAETSLDDPEIPDAADVWIEAIDNAQRRIDFEHFYASSHEGSRLEEVIDAIERAAERGVKIRFLVDEKFYKIPGNDEVPGRLDDLPNVEVRRLDLGPVTDGVQHAKFFVVDGYVAVIGSQNFDWRSLEHIHELGIVSTATPLSYAAAEIFEIDWAIAGGASPETAVADVDTADGAAPGDVYFGDARVTMRTALSPKPILAEGANWDLPLIVEAIDGAEKRVRVQVMSYSTVNYDKSTFTELDDALKRADERGVEVELLIANWSKAPYKAKHLQEMQQRPHTTVRFANIPEASSGFIPYARVIHSKYMTVDGHTAWLGTSNWSGDYFSASRNVGVMLEGKSTADTLDRVFDRIWTSEYAETVDPAATYEAPRYKE